MNGETFRNVVEPSSRRGFLKTSAAAAGGFALASIAPRAFAGGSDALKIGLIGCGGRGTGAASQALRGDPNVKLTAMGDMFPDKMEVSLKALRAEPDLANKLEVAPETQFLGFDAYKQVIDSGVDVVLLTAPPCFRPAHLKYAVEKGKHIFCEKPVAVDAPGIRSVFATVEEARKRGLALVSGLCWRYDFGMRELFDQILDKQALGEILAIQATYHTQTLKKFPRQPGWSDMEFQLRNWQHFVWGSGDHNVEQHVHSLDKAAWALKDVPPLKCTGSGGRQARTGEESGNVYDHFSVVYEYANGVKVLASCRQIDNCSNDTSDHIIGTKATATTLPQQFIKSGDTTVWSYKGKRGNMYQNEHDELFASIRAGNPLNNGDYMTKSSMMAIMGRMSAYTGKTITWEQAMNSKEDLTPPKYEFGPLPVAPVAIPGVTQFA
jgi:predicted dehydrogenase